MKELCYVDFDKSEVKLEDRSVINSRSVRSDYLLDHLIAVFPNDNNTYLIVKEGTNAFRRYKIDWLFNN